MKIIGFVMLIGGVLLGLYIGGWLFLIGGIAGLVDIIVSAVNGGAVNGMDIALNIGKVIFAGLAGYISAAVLILPSIAILKRR